MGCLGMHRKQHTALVDGFLLDQPVVGASGRRGGWAEQQRNTARRALLRKGAKLGLTQLLGLISRSVIEKDWHVVCVWFVD